jgi:hypothetical protein
MPKQNKAVRLKLQRSKNALAYFASAVGYERKMFITLPPVANVIKLFTAVSDEFS